MLRLYFHGKRCHHLMCVGCLFYPGTLFLSIGWMGWCNSVEPPLKVFYTSSAGKMERKTQGGVTNDTSLSVI